MSLRDVTYLIDILEAARLVQKFLSDIDKKAFEVDLMRQSAVIRQMEVVGEATKRLSEAFKANHPELPWRNMAGMRDILIHAYDHVDIEEVWNAAKVSIPDLIKKIEPLVPKE